MGYDCRHISCYSRYQRNESGRPLLVRNVDGHDFEKRQSSGAKGNSIRSNHPFHGDYLWRLDEYRSSVHASSFEKRRLFNIVYGLVPSHKHLAHVDPLHRKRHWLLYVVAQNPVLIVP